jgi:hypothetical protein
LVEREKEIRTIEIVKRDKKEGKKKEVKEKD